MKITKWAFTIALTGTAIAALALPAYVPVFDATYGLEKHPNLKKAACSICHIGNGPKCNAYGLDIKAEMQRQKTKTITADILKKVENLDSDKDGVKNGVELKADTLPGDPKSKPKK